MNANITEQEEEEAALWVARHMGGPVDATAFSQWLDGGPERRALFDAMWASCMDVNVTAALQEHGTKQDNEPPVDVAPEQSGRGFGLRRMAGFGAVAAVLLAVLTFNWGPMRSALTPAETYQTTAGEVREITLADGSSVVLNGASAIEVRFAEGERHVELEAGEALFDVAHDRQRPFTVAAGDGRVTVLGTRFDLALNGEQVDLEVARGLVRFAGADDEANAVLVKGAYRSTLVAGVPSQPQAYAVSDEPAWRSGWLDVADIPLAQLLPRLERWTGKSIEVKDQSLLDRRVAGRFRLSQPATVLDNLGVIHGFTVRETDESFVLEKP